MGDDASMICGQRLLPHNAPYRCLSNSSNCRPQESIIRRFSCSFETDGSRMPHRFQKSFFEAARLPDVSGRQTPSFPISMRTLRIIVGGGLCLFGLLANLKPTKIQLYYAMEP